MAPQRRNIAMVFQNYALYPHLCVFENIAFGLRAAGFKRQIIEERVQDVSKTLNLSGKLKNYPRQLSGGERQRVATGRAIVREPQLFLFDEPLSNLDARLRVGMRGEFIKLHQRLKKTMIYVTHDQTEAMILGEMIVVLKDGRTQQVSSPRELYDSPENLFVAEFIGTPPMNILRLKIQKSDNRIILKDDGFRIQAPSQMNRVLESYAKDEIYLGFRPSASSISNQGVIKGEVIFTQTLGEESFVQVKVSGGQEVLVKLRGAGLPEPAESLAIEVDCNALHFFDLDGKRVDV
jgi:ABC-type sugar transport system ATPase subunit